MEGKYKVDISDNVEFGKKRSMPGGWQQITLVYKGESIGWIEGGNPDMRPGFDFELKDELVDGQNGKRLIIYKYQDYKPVDEVYN